MFSPEGLVLRLIEKVCQESLMFADASIKLLFTIVSILSALFRNVSSRVNNLDILAE